MSEQKLLLSWRKRFQRDKSLQLEPLEFDMPEGVEYLQIFYDYNPKGSKDKEKNFGAVNRAVENYVKGSRFEGANWVEKVWEVQGLSKMKEWIRNQLNLIIYDSKGEVVGRFDLANYKEPPPVLIGKMTASPGFRPNKMDPGVWTAVIEVWEVFSDEVDVRLDILPITEPSLDIDTVPMVRPPTGKSTTVDRPRVPNIMYGEMHTHSIHSDGKYPIFMIAERAERLGLDFVALTDHNTISGLSEIMDFPVLLIRGMEITTYFGHFNVYGTNKCYQWHEKGKRFRIQECLEDARRDGCLLSLNHPTAIGPPVCIGCSFRDDMVSYGSFDCMEVWCGAWKRRFPETDRNIRLWDRLLSEGYRITGISGRDWHNIAQEDTKDISFPVTGVLCKDRREESILDAIRMGRAFMTSGPAIEWRVSDGEKEFNIGDSLIIEDGRRVFSEAKFYFVNPTKATARLVYDGKVIQTIDVSDRLECAYETEVTKPGRYRIEIWGDDGELLLLTNHIWILEKKT